MSCISGSTNASSSNDGNNNNSNNQTSSSSTMTGYLKDHFNVSFVDCKCCCDASKEISKCQTGTLDILRNIQEYIDLPEYRLNCRCVCGGDDEQNNNTPVKFGINLTPANDLK